MTAPCPLLALCGVRASLPLSLVPPRERDGQSTGPRGQLPASPARQLPSYSCSSPSTACLCAEKVQVDRVEMGTGFLSLVTATDGVLLVSVPAGWWERLHSILLDSIAFWFLLVKINF